MTVMGSHEVAWLCGNLKCFPPLLQKRKKKTEIGSKKKVMIVINMSMYLIAVS